MLKNLEQTNGKWKWLSETDKKMMILAFNNRIPAMKAIKAVDIPITRKTFYEWKRMYAHKGDTHE